VGLADVQPDFLGRAYEYLLRKFAEGSGQSAGEFFTPTEVGFLMAHIMRPKPGQTCHDYACGSAGLLIKLQLVARELDPTSKVPLKLSGQELQAESYAVAQMNAIIHDMEVELQRGDTMINPKFRNADGRLTAQHRRRESDVEPAVRAGRLRQRPIRPLPHGGRHHQRQGRLAWLQHTLASMDEHGDLLRDFLFPTPGDRSRALASVITPALTMGGLVGGYAPLDIAEATAPQSGKGYRQKLTHAVYGERAYTVARRQGGVGSIAGASHPRGAAAATQATCGWISPRGEGSGGRARKSGDHPRCVDRPRDPFAHLVWTTAALGERGRMQSLFPADKTSQ
jgi:hypothetical protein